MNGIRIMMVIAAALPCACALAHDASTSQQPAQEPAQTTSTTSFGGTSSMSGESGTPAALTRQQVYQQLIQSRSSGESQRLQELYHGN